LHKNHENHQRKFGDNGNSKGFVEKRAIFTISLTIELNTQQESQTKLSFQILKKLFLSSENSVLRILRFLSLSQDDEGFKDRSQIFKWWDDGNGLKISPNILNLKNLSSPRV